MNEEYKQELETYNKIKQDYIDAKKKYFLIMKEKGNQLIEAIFRLYFEENPDIFSVAWAQYTPYFNDGDECIFSANIDYPSFNYVEEDDDHQSDSRYSYNYPFKDCTFEQYKEYNKKFTDFMIKHGLDDEETLKELFGDHAGIEIRKGEDGEITTLVEYYDHE